MNQPPGLPEQFGRYVLVRKLAEGGMAEIWLAKQLGPDNFSRTLVLKRVLPHLAGQQEFLNMFLDEARIAAGLQHPNVVQITEYGVEDDRHFIAMEYLPGEDLYAILRMSVNLKKYIPPAVAAKILAAACDGLHYAHELLTPDGSPMGLVHRDISPSNIFVTYHGSVKVLDFGIAKAENKLAHTKTGAVKGKFAYMSPEQASGEPLDRRSDIFALGVVLYELLAGQRLFKRDSELAVLKAILQDPIPHISSARPDLPGELSAVVTKALSRRREDRYQSAEEMRAALDAFLSVQDHGAQANLKTFMWELFGEERAKERLRDPSPNLRSMTPSGGVPLGTRKVSLDNRTEMAQAGGGTQAVPSDQLGAPLAKPGRKGLGLALSIGVGVAVLGVGGIFALKSGQSTQAGPTDAAVSNPNSTGPKVEMATLVINTEPSGATIYVDDRPSGTSPAAVKELPAGKTLSVRLELGGYEAHATQVELQSGEVKVVQFRLTAKKSGLLINGAPTGAQVFVDGKASGNAGGRLEVEPGTREIRVTAAGFRPFSTSANVAAGETRTIDVKLEKLKQAVAGSGDLTVNCAPVWCRIYLDGKDTEKVTPFTFKKVPAGNHNVRVHSPPLNVQKEEAVSVVANVETKKLFTLR